MNRLKKLTATQLCERIKELGYSVGQRIQLYGENVEVVSDPVVKDGLVAVRVRSNGGSERVLYLPATVVQVAEDFEGFHQRPHLLSSLPELNR